ncbi:LemA protein [Salibacterium salarium]|uniref:LemA family protein n=1 Tax=Salibacterium salarium TaxID=284579 RepID=UPI0027808C09|nr:LemA family protein [Salibacterium salarium]MDQ0299892.1 LemA protein [Salibacterium salarium]
MTVFGAILGILIIIALVSWIIGYNALIKYLSWVEEAWAQIEVQLKRRIDIIPDLIDIAQQRVKHEQHTLERIVELRSELTSPQTSKFEQIETNEQLTQTLHSLFALKEENNELEQDKDFLSLEKSLKDSDIKLKKAIKVYNNTVQKYNNKIQSIPANFVANIHSFKVRDTVDIPQNEKNDVKLSS